MVDLILDIESFEQKHFILKGLLQSDQLKQHMVIILICQLSNDSAMYEHSCLKNINKLCTSAVKCDNQHKYKAIIELVMFSPPEISTKNSTISPGPSVTVINNIARKILSLFTEVLDVKNKTDVRRVDADK